MDQLNKILGHQFADTFHDYGKFSISTWRYQHRLRLSVISKFIKQYGTSDVALDAGSGKGPITFLLSKSFKTVHSYEYSNDEIERLKENLRKTEISHKNININIKQVDLTNIPLENNSIDFIVCSEVLEHIPKEKAAAQELYRVLKNDSYMVCSMPNKHSLVWINERFIDYLRRFILKRKLPTIGHEYWELKRHWSFSSNDIENILISSGFRIVETEGVGFLSFSPRLYRLFYESNLLKYFVFLDVMLSKIFKKFSPFYFVIVTKTK